MKSSDNLFQLIKSLSKSEKRQFKLNSSLQTGEKNYLKLFDYLDRQKSYNEEDILSYFKGETFAESLHVTKNYLYNLILKSLRSSYEKKSIDIQLFNLLSDASILEHKGLYKQSNKLISKALQKAQKHHKQLIIIECLLRTITNTMTSQKNLVAQTEELCNTLLAQLQKLDSEINQFCSKAFLFGLYRERNQYSVDNLSEVLQKWDQQNELLKSLGTKSSFYARSYFFQAQAVYHRLQKNNKAAFPFYEKAVQLWENDTQIIKEKPHVYKILLSNYLGSCFDLNKLDNFLTDLDKIKKIPSKTFDEAAETFQNIYYLEFLYYTNTFQFEKAKSIVPIIDDGLIKYQTKINKARELIFHFNIAVLYFALEDFDAALKRLNQILHEKRLAPRKDIQNFSRILEIILHYELGNDRVLDYFFKSTYLQYKRKNILSSFEKLVFDYLKRLPDIITLKESQALFKDFHHALRQLSAQDQNVLGFDEIRIWTASKHSNSSFVEIMKNQV